MDKNKDAQTLQRQTGACISLHQLQPQSRSDLREKLVLFAMEPHFHLAQGSEKLIEEIWQELEELCGLGVALGSQAKPAGQRQCSPAAAAPAALQVPSGRKLWLLLHFHLPDLMQNTSCGQG